MYVGILSLALISIHGHSPLRGRIPIHGHSVNVGFLPFQRIWPEKDVRHFITLYLEKQQVSFHSFTQGLSILIWVREITCSIIAPTMSQL